MGGRWTLEVVFGIRVDEVPREDAADVFAVSCPFGAAHDAADAVFVGFGPLADVFADVVQDVGDGGVFAGGDELFDFVFPRVGFDAFILGRGGAGEEFGFEPPGGAGAEGVGGFCPELIAVAAEGFDVEGA